MDISLSIERNIFEKMCQLGNIDHNNIQPNISIAFKKEENKKCSADFKEFFEIIKYQYLETVERHTVVCISSL
ncbi:hypothetical protein BSPWISOXPB_4296 [uncultured Gammaproteobacteria bacterium]|nr:hypothetical protein BSPWISOXPB_4296 [uncultured Gammaproteobacteria bacterium]